MKITRLDIESTSYVHFNFKIWNEIERRIGLDAQSNTWIKIVDNDLKKVNISTRMHQGE